MLSDTRKPRVAAKSEPQSAERDAAIARGLRTAFFGATALLGLGLMLMPTFNASAILYSPLWFYGAILTGLAIAGYLLDRSRFMAIATAIAYFLAADLSLAAISAVGHKAKLMVSLLPNSGRSMLTATGFRFHPLLQFALTPGYAQRGFVHTQVPTRAVVEPPPGPQSRTNVALVGGSSTYDIDVSQGDTWPDRLQEMLPQYRFWNFGVPSYTTAAHVVQTAWYLPEVHAKCAIYYIGWNDIRNSNLPNLDPAFANYHLLDLGQYARNLTDNGPTATWRLFSLVVWSLRPQPGVPAYYRTVTPRTGLDKKLAAYYRQNAETIVGINRQRGVKVGFIGQLLNYPLLMKQPPGQRAFAAPGVEDRNIPEAMEQMNQALADEAAKLGVPYLAPRQDWLEKEDYTDFGHFTASGAKKFAKRVSDFIRLTCQ